MRFILIAAAAALTLTTAMAQELEPGWSITFKRNSFDKSPAVAGSASELGVAIGGNVLAATCAGSNVIFFFSGRLILSPKPQAIDFRSNGGSETFTFQPLPTKQFGRQLSLDSERSNALRALLTNANGAPVAYRTEGKQGRFPSVGAARALAILAAECALYGDN